MIVFVTGTDTGVGKTVATAALAVHLGPDVVVVKPTQTGTDEPDAEVVRRLAGCRVAQLAHLPDPLAPDTAARLRGTAVPAIGEHATRLAELARRYEVVIVEGAGGALVRLDTAGGTLPDLAAELARDHEVRVQVVTRVGLGTLNHTELTVEALRGRGLDPAGLVLGSVPAKPDLAERCNTTELPRVTGVPVLAALPEGAGSLPPGEFRARAGSWFR
ncbi:dethiobiotin synthase [Saccharopolyspora flava]|uniref:ATP-dependent dethiobiotin synthetase BioD n=1 Tax=Saccharopolyspora flava TaxID=95161 RepID=A0A1I6S6J1_9PSEU|nr:dethiobiotin synthase [Saccharopolyspora flava]SFS72513.1 dethiobiotin synthetase [Saccharopolyspora flava]